MQAHERTNIKTSHQAFGLILPVAIVSYGLPNVAYAATLSETALLSKSIKISNAQLVLTDTTAQSIKFQLAQDPLSRLLNAMERAKSEIQIYALNEARNISTGYNVEWRNAVPQLVLSDRTLRVSLYGKIKLPTVFLPDKDVRLTLSFRPDSNLQFRYAGFDLNVLSRCGPVICKPKLRKARRFIEQALNERSGQMEEAVNREAQRLISSIVSVPSNQFADLGTK